MASGSACADAQAGKYRGNPEWADVTPIPQDDGPVPVVSIQYAPSYVEAMDYFRAMLKANELSARALAVTSDIIEQNPSFYTAWHYRRLCLRALGSDLRQELAFVDTTLAENQKNYQIWHHRRCIVEWLGMAEMIDTELRFTEYAIRLDEKNYHAWAHRQWVLKATKKFGGELEFLEQLVLDDIRNNSAWNHRHFVVSAVGIDDAVRAREIKYSCDAIRKAPNNESPWVYLRSFVRGQPAAVSAPVRDLCDDLLATMKTPCVWVFSMLLEFAVEDHDRAEALKLCNLLETAVDPTRARYWKHRALQLSTAA